MIGLYLICPDTPVKNPDLSYFKILWTMAVYAVTEPMVIQGSLILFAGNATFAGFWVTMTFLLNGAPYHYSTSVFSLYLLFQTVDTCSAW
jgi:hypothetical protein